MAKHLKDTVLVRKQSPARLGSKHSGRSGAGESHHENQDGVVVWELAVAYQGWVKGAYALAHHQAGGSATTTPPHCPEPQRQPLFSCQSKGHPFSPPLNKEDEKQADLRSVGSLQVLEGADTTCEKGPS